MNQLKVHWGYLSLNGNGQKHTFSDTYPLTNNNLVQVDNLEVSIEQLYDLHSSAIVLKTQLITN